MLAYVYSRHSTVVERLITQPEVIWKESSDEMIIWILSKITKEDYLLLASRSELDADSFLLDYLVQSPYYSEEIARDVLLPAYFGNQDASKIGIGQFESFYECLNVNITNYLQPAILSKISPELSKKFTDIQFQELSDNFRHLNTTTAFLKAFAKDPRLITSAKKDLILKLAESSEVETVTDLLKYLKDMKIKPSEYVNYINPENIEELAELLSNNFLGYLLLGFKRLPIRIRKLVDEILKYVSKDLPRLVNWGSATEQEELSKRSENLQDYTEKEGLLEETEVAEESIINYFKRRLLNKPISQEATAKAQKLIKAKASKK